MFNCTLSSILFLLETAVNVAKASFGAHNMAQSTEQTHCAEERESNGARDDHRKLLESNHFAAEEGYTTAHSGNRTTENAHAHLSVSLLDSAMPRRSHRVCVVLGQVNHIVYSETDQDDNRDRL